MLSGSLLMAYSVESDTMGNKRVHHRSVSFLRLVRPCFGLFEADSRSEVRTPQLSSREPAKASQINNSARRGDPWRSGPSIRSRPGRDSLGLPRRGLRSVLLSERVVPSLWKRRKEQRWERAEHFQMQAEL